ncbi:MAG TPA: dephospho-CoA kinase [Bacteroidota bacterium]|nr:dephospho-CoA kinase [Bacteroidota bacterium]
MGDTHRYHTLAVGVTGGIGSGKTEACRIFESFGVRVLYADPIARNLINSDEQIRQSVRRLFGDSIYTETGLDRKVVAKKIFADETLQKKLNAIVHPPVLDAIARELRRAREKAEEAMVLVEAALMFESGASRMFDYMLLIDADEEVRISRVIARDHSSRSDVLGRVRAQLPLKEKSLRSDFIIHNNNDVSTLRQQCQFLHTMLCRIAEGK